MLEHFQNVFNEENRRRVSKEMKTLPRLVARSSAKLKVPPRVSAVLVPMCVVMNKPGLLFTKRSSALIQNRGEVRFVLTDVENWNVEI